MVRKIINIILIASLITGMTGCEALQRKFTRKKKAKAVRPMFYRKGEGETTRPPSELYITHYIYWKAWMDDLINNAGTNKKRDKRACDEAVSDLLDMKKYLEGEKKEELDKYINETRKLTDKIAAGSLTKMRLGRIKQQLDGVKRRIMQKFRYKKVKGFIKSD